MNGNVANWSGGAFFSFVSSPGAADSTGSVFIPCCAYGSTIHLGLWGPNLPYGQAVNNGLTATSPAGGNFLSADSDPGNSRALTQTVNGLTVGKKYSLSFWYAAAQDTQWDDINGNQGLYFGATTSGWLVSIGGNSLTGIAPRFSIPSQGFSGWAHVSTTFTANSTSELLSFFADSSNQGNPPMALLDGVDIHAIGGVPEPAAWSMMLIGVGILGATARRRRLAQA